MMAYTSATIEWPKPTLTKDSLQKIFNLRFQGNQFSLLVSFGLS